ncbi:MAG TPA: 3-oxoacyl-[acyl-carrier-protein] reductase [Phycisphaerae bacterium]|nr:3-oxoacyl-[acyl-carrier-protein] reductase [Phycisphaerae bacterium]
MLLKDQVAVVTGAARGIGRAISLALADEGAHIVAVDVLADVLDSTVGEITAKGVKAVARQVNVTDTEQVEQLFASVVSDFDRLDIMVNNAGITRDTLLLSMDDQQWDQVIQVNLRGVFLCTRAAAKIMLRQRYGRIVNMASVSGLMGNAGQANYAASKAGVVGLTKTVAKEMAKRKVTCNAVAPGFIKTDMTDALPEKVREQVKQLIPAGRFGLPEDVAAAVVFLASPQAEYITGQVLSVDGGLYM